MEGIWTGCRNVVRLFRGVSKWFLAGYIAVFERSHNLKWVTSTLVHAMMMPSTTQPTSAAEVRPHFRSLLAGERRRSGGEWFARPTHFRTGQ